MKTQKINLVRTITTVMLLTTLIVSISCKKNEVKAQTTETQIVEAPSMDINTAAFMGDIKAVEQHIKAGSDLNKKDDYGSTPLATAATFGKTAIAIALIDGGADINTKSGDGSTPLHTAAFFCRPEIVKALLNKGADKTIRNNYGSTALESVVAPFSDVKPVYDQIGKSLGPFGLKFDYDYLETTRPIIAQLLQ